MAELCGRLASPPSGIYIPRVESARSFRAIQRACDFLELEEIVVYDRSIVVVTRARNIVGGRRGTTWEVIVSR